MKEGPRTSQPPEASAFHRGQNNPFIAKRTNTSEKPNSNGGSSKNTLVLAPGSWVPNVPTREESRTGKGMEHQKSLRTTNLSQVQGKKGTNMKADVLLHRYLVCISNWGGHTVCLMQCTPMGTGGLWYAMTQPMSECLLQQGPVACPVIETNKVSDRGCAWQITHRMLNLKWAHQETATTLNPEISKKVPYTVHFGSNSDWAKRSEICKGYTCQHSFLGCSCTPRPSSSALRFCSLCQDTHDT